MLKVLEIENIAVIEKAAVQFDTGLNVLTGETGAGKSIVVDAINAILASVHPGSWCATVRPRQWYAPSLRGWTLPCRL